MIVLANSVDVHTRFCSGQGHGIPSALQPISEVIQQTHLTCLPLVRPSKVSFTDMGCLGHKLPAAPSLSWVFARLADEGNLSRTQMLESKWIAKCMLNYISRNRCAVPSHSSPQPHADTIPYVCLYVQF